ncbi:MAG TPA: DNA gyrase subunit A, partial [Alphaproteobacteria bacterium]|nr:DNA gyrase subunit A [Alphaproteobacteria bacterium]
NLLVNGAGGIAVGMATNIPTHNLGEVIDACVACIDNPEITIDELMDIVPGPDFPTGGIILGRSGIRSAFHTGRGSVLVRGRTHIETIRKEREAIVVTEIPYQVNKARMVERVAELVREKRIEGIADLRDESDREGVRVVIELKRDAMADIVLNQLYQYTPLQSTFGVNALALLGGRPELLNFKQMIEAFIDFREEVVTRRTVFELGRARDRAHVLVGLAIAVSNLDEVIKLIRAAKDPNEARLALIEREWPAEAVAGLVQLIDEPGRRVVDGRYRLSDAQARAILELRLQRLTGLERDKIADELKAIAVGIRDYLAILQSRERLYAVIRDELNAIREEFATPRRTEISGQEFAVDVEDLIQREDMVVTVSHAGYIKRVPLSTYRAQRRGGRGRAGMAIREEDFVSQVFVANTHAPVLFFSTAGKVYKMKVYRLPEAAPNARGKALVNLLPLAEEETISTVMPLPEDERAWEDRYVMFATSSGDVRRNRLSDFFHVMANGKIAMKLEIGDRLVGVATCTEEQHVLLAARGGKCVRFPVTEVRVFSGRTSTGVRGIRLAQSDQVISMSMLDGTEVGTEERYAYLRHAAAQRRAAGVAEEPEAVVPAAEEEGEGEAVAAVQLSEARIAELAQREQFILSVTENGYGKRTSAYEYRVTRRGGSGIVNIAVTPRNGPVVASFPVADPDQLMLVTDKGQIIRVPVEGIRIASRSTQGVVIFRVAEGERVVSLARLAEGGEDNNGARSEGVPGANGGAHGGGEAAEAGDG